MKARQTAWSNGLSRQMGIRGAGWGSGLNFGFGFYFDFFQDDKELPTARAARKVTPPVIINISVVEVIVSIVIFTVLVSE